MHTQRKTSTNSILKGFLIIIFLKNPLARNKAGRLYVGVSCSKWWRPYTENGEQMLWHYQEQINLTCPKVFSCWSHSCWLCTLSRTSSYPLAWKGRIPAIGQPHWKGLKEGGGAFLLHLSTLPIFSASAVLVKTWQLEIPCHRWM